jgi:sulfopyruvate decarboxylase subunit beta
MSATPATTRMPVEQALEHLQRRRRDNEIVVTNQSSARLWPTLSDHRLDFNYNPSTMSGAVPLAVGLAMAKPDREVIVLSGDGSLLMSLGCLVTTVASGVTNLSILLLDNSMYEVTGGQQTAASRLPVDYAGLARAAGFRQVARFNQLEDWQQGCDRLLDSAGPRFAWLEVGPTPASVLSNPQALAPIDERIGGLRRALAE